MKKISALLFSMGMFYAHTGYAEEVSQEGIFLNQRAAITGNYIGVQEYGHMFGISVFILNDGFGFYGGIKSSTSTRGEPFFDRDVRDAVDPVVSRFKVADMLAIGATWSAPQYLSVYLGAGIASNSGYAELYGPVARPGEPTFNQTYYVNDAANSSSELFLDGGVVLSLGPLSLQLGRNSLTESYEIGLGAHLTY